MVSQQTRHTTIALARNKTVALGDLLCFLCLPVSIRAFVGCVFHFCCLRLAFKRCFLLSLLTLTGIAAFRRLELVEMGRNV